MASAEFVRGESIPSMRLGISPSAGQKRLDGGDGRSRGGIISRNNVFGGSG